MKAVNFNVEVLGYGPILNLEEDKDLTPQQTSAISSSMTYKSGSAREIAIDAINAIKEDIKKEGKDLKEDEVEKAFNKKIRNTLIESVGRGHASISTSAGLWCLFNGVSKFVDSMFTGARFSSSLMPSGRRIPVTIEEIVAPESIFNSDNEVKNIYYEISKSNIELYKFLVDNKIKKEEAAKITQYGLDGGGFIYLPLETIIGYKHEFEIEGKWIPKEGYDFINQIESQLKELGMDILYWARNFAPRNTYNYPNIFTDPNKGSFVKSKQKLREDENPCVEHDYFNSRDGKEFIDDLKCLKDLSEEIKRNPEDVKERWGELLLARKDFVKRYNGIISFNSFSDVSWRVWGEVKRHRTLEQSVESVYHAIKRAKKILNDYNEWIIKGELNDGIVEKIANVFIIPRDIKKDNEMKRRWISNIMNSFSAYDKLVRNGIPESDAIAVIPRGLRLSVFKRFDLYNIVDGYLPLRLCGTAETEMREITESEEKKIKENSNVVDNLSYLIGPKCSAVGFCLEKTYCGKVNDFIGFKPYSKEFHDEMDGIRKQLIYDKI